MKLSEAILLGSTIKELDPMDWSSCLLGISVAALGCANNLLNHEGTRRWPWITIDMDTPDIYRREWVARRIDVVSILSNLAISVKQGHVTLEEVVDWVRSVEPREEQTDGGQGPVEVALEVTSV